MTSKPTIVPVTSLPENINTDEPTSKPTIVPVTSLPENINTDEPIAIAKPGEFSLDKFKSTRTTIAGVETLPTALPVHNIKDANDYVRLHPDEAKYWSMELCFVNVPIKGQQRDTLHLIVENLAIQHLPSSRIQRFRLALAAKASDQFFLCVIPSQNLDNTWNRTNLQACETAKIFWVRADRREDGAEGYQTTFARHQKDTPGGAAFAEPSWPTQTLEKLINVTFAPDRLIDNATHPGLLRLTGARQSMS